MANLKSSKKNTRKIAKQTARNRQVKSKIKTLRKNVKLAEKPEDKKAAARLLVSALDKAAKTNVIHANKARRHKSEVSAYLYASK